MVTITSLRNVEYDAYDEVWVITQVFPEGMTAHAIHVPELAPEKHLFWDARSRMKDGTFTEEWFRDEYVPRYRQGIMNDKEALMRLNEAFVRSKRGQNICMVCYCADEHKCHRSIVAGLLQSVGTDVKTDTGADYSEYGIGKELEG